MAFIVQKLRKEVLSDIEKAVKYYTILSILNDLSLTPKQIELLAFMSIRGTITPPSARQEFIEMFDSSLASLENIKNKLCRNGWIVEKDKMYRVNPRLVLDFSKNIILQINIESDGGNKVHPTETAVRNTSKDDSRENGKTA